MVHKAKGSITVFLSFILVMILSLIGTLLDVARISLADSFSYRALVSAVDTEFTKYCYELYDDYHIYMLDSGHNEENLTGEEFASSISDYLMYTFDPDSDLELLGTGISIKGTDLLDLTMDNCKVENTVALSDYDAKIFQDQVAQYMKYYVAANAADGILEKLKLMKQSGETMTVVRKKNEVDEAVSKVDKKMMKLMQEVEGITFKNNSLVVTDDYAVEVQKSFAKQFYTGSHSAIASTIRHNVIWDSLKDSYINPVEILKGIQNDIASYESSASSIDTLTEEIKKLDEEIANTQQKILNAPVPTIDPASTNDPEEEEKETEDEKELQKLEEEREKKQKELEGLKEKLSPLLKGIKKKSKTLYKDARQVKLHTVRALTYIDEVKEAKEGSIAKLSDFESTLADYKAKIPEDSYHGVKEEYEETKNYIQKQDGEGNDISAVGTALNMKETLKTNEAILDSTISVMNNGSSITVETFGSFSESIGRLIDQYDAYSIKQLRFDYSTLKIEKKPDSPLDSFGSLVGSGILELIVDDPKALSDKTLDSSGLVSATKSGTEKEGKDENEDLAGKLKDPDSDGTTGVSDNLKSYEESCKSASTEGGTANELMRKFLINEYGATTFINLMDELGTKKQGEAQADKKQAAKKQETEKEKDGEQKETVLKYEQEYLVNGGMSDLENAKSIVMRTLFMRTAGNYLSLLTNSGCRQKAKATAMALVGFTGFAPLIAITQQLILIAWGFEEGLVDSRVMLDGNEVPFFKKAADFSVKYKDLLTISKASIKKKASAYKQKKSSLASVSYNDYVRLYMLMVPQDTLSLRMMDLIQANMRLRYDSQFSMLNGIFGMKVSMDVTMPGKFLTIPFVKDFAGYDGRDIKFHVSTEYSY